MSLRIKLASVAACATAVAALVGLAPQAQAATTGATTTTFTLQGGVLAITAPSTKDLGTVATGTASTASTQLGSVAVSDGRGALLGSWTTSVSSTDFTTGAKLVVVLASRFTGAWSTCYWMVGRFAFSSVARALWKANCAPAPNTAASAIASRVLWAYSRIARFIVCLEFRLLTSTPSPPPMTRPFQEHYRFVM